MFSFLVAGSKAKGDADLQPAKGAVLMDIEDENEDVEKPAKEGAEKGEDVATPVEKCDILEKCSPFQLRVAKRKVTPTFNRSWLFH